MTIFRKRALPLVFLALMAGIACLQGARVEQAFALRPGWNAIYLEVEPADRSPAAVFNNGAIKQVWSSFAGDSAVGYITSPDETWNDGVGRRYVPANRPEAVVTDLFSIFGNRAYLVEVGGTTSINLTVTGEPARVRRSWTGGSLNFSSPAVE